MAVQFDVSGHALLSPEAQDVESQDPSAFTELNDAAEYLLELKGGVDQSKTALASMAVVYQVNHMAAHMPDAEILDSKSVDMRSWSFPDSVPNVSDMAEELLGKIDPDAGRGTYAVQTHL